MTALAISSRLTDPEVHATGEAHNLWRWLRENAPIQWHTPDDFPGFWSLTTYEDVRAVYRDPDTFSSAEGVLLRPVALGKDPGSGRTLALTDPPRHRRLRALLAEWFSERHARSLEPEMRRLVRFLLNRAAQEDVCDFSHDVAAPFTNSIICKLLGVPRADHGALFTWTYEAFAAAKPLATHPTLMQYIINLMDDRARNPVNDILSRLITSEIDGIPLTEEEVLLNCENLIGATENAGLSMSAGAFAFVENPHQWERLRAHRELLRSAIEEVLRWASSAVHSMRTATKDAFIRGHRIGRGDRVVLWIPSANYDDTVFEEPDRFDVSRRPNRHLTFGAGEHACIGATLARTQLKVLLTELLEMHATMELGGSVVRLRSIFVSGPEQLPVHISRLQSTPVESDQESPIKF